MIPINKRKIGVCIILSIITLGIYQIYWEYLLVKNTRAVKKDDSSCIGEMLCLIFVPFYSLFWWFTRGKLVKDAFAEHGYSAIGNEIAYLVLSIFGLDLVSMAIMQNDFNSLSSASTQSIPRSTKKIVCARNLLALIPACGVCIGGYYLYEALITQNFVSPLAGIPGYITQSVLSSALYILLGLTLDRLKIKQRFLGDN